MTKTILNVGKDHFLVAAAGSKALVEQIIIMSTEYISQYLQAVLLLHVPLQL